MPVKQLKVFIHPFLNAFLCMMSLAFCIFSQGSFANFPVISNNPIIPAAPLLNAKSYLLIDNFSNYVIAEHDANERLEPASLTKMMTVYVADQALKHNKIKLTDLVNVSEKAWRATGSRMFLNLNTQVPVGELLKGIIIQSGNDASIALAEYIAGSEENFANIMNYYAKELGMTNSHFVNATGLPDPNHYTTASDMALLAKAIIRDFPESYSLYSQKEFTFHNIKQTNRNRLLWKHDWVDGIKTGHTETAGFCLVASGQQAGMRLISVLMGAKNDNERTNETNQLLTYGFQYFESRKMLPKDTAVKQARIWMGKVKEIGIGLKEDLYATVPKGQADHLTTNIQINDEIKAPLAKGTPLGFVQLELNGKVITKQPMIALETVPEANIFSRIIDYIHLWFQALWKKIS